MPSIMTACPDGMPSIMMACPDGMHHRPADCGFAALQLDGAIRRRCTHGWALLTGCKEQYTIRKTDSGTYGCYGTFNPNEQKWETLANSPHEGFSGLWPMAWPPAGGGGDLGHELTQEELFERMCHWDDHNYIVGAATQAGSDQNQTDGMFHGHAYSVLTCKNDVAGTDVDLIQIRNPHGCGELTARAVRHA